MASTKTNTRDDTKTLTTSWRNRHLEKIYVCVFVLETYGVELLGFVYLKSYPTIYGNNRMAFRQIINIIWLTQSKKTTHY